MEKLILAIGLRIFSNPFSNVLQKQLTLNGCRPFDVNFLTYTGLSLISLLFLYEININELPLIVWVSAILEGFAEHWEMDFL